MEYDIFADRLGTSMSGGRVFFSKNSKETLCWVAFIQ